MCGLIERFESALGQREILLAILPGSVGDMPGCLGIETLPSGDHGPMARAATGA